MSTSPQASPSSAAVLAPDGSVVQVPNTELQNALKAGGKLAVPMRSPAGDLHWIPSDQFGEAQKQGGKVDWSAVPAQHQEGFTHALLGDVGGMIKGAAQTVGAGMSGNPGIAAGAMAAQTGGQIAANDYALKADNRSVPYRIASGVAQAAGVNAPAMEEAARQGDTAGVIGHAAAPAVAAAAADGGARVFPKLIRSTGSAAGEVIAPIKEAIPPSVEEMTGTTPQRISQLQQFPKQVEGIRQQVIAAEKTAHKAASDAFPQFNKPIEISRTTEPVDTGLVDERGQPIIRQEEKVQTATFKELQEQRSNLLQDIAQEKVAVSRGAAPRFDLARMYEKLHGLDDVMSKAALDEGGADGLAKLQQARQQFAKYMQDFHNQGSALRPILESQPGETAKVMGQFLNPDKGARALEALRSNKVDTSGIESMLTKGDRPVRVNIAESAKLRKAGNPEAYTTQRLNESLSQAEYNELPSTAQARLPAKVMKSKWPSVVGETPGVNLISPRRITTMRIKSALAKRNP